MNINKSIKKFKMAFKCLWLSNFYFSSGHLSNQNIVSMCAISDIYNNIFRKI